MGERLYFIEGGNPLTTRIWFEVDDKLTKDTVISKISERQKTIEQAIALEVHLFIKNPTEAADDNIVEILQDIYQFKAGFEKSFPVVSIYYPAAKMSLELLNRINACDKYRPGINIYLLLNDEELPIDKDLSSMRELAGRTVDVLQKSQDLGLNSVIYLLLEKDPKCMEGLLELRRLIYTWDTSLNMKKPLLQVSPLIDFDKAMVDMLLRYIQKEGEASEVLDTLCGLTSMLIRYRENRAVPTEYVPLGACGAGQNEIKHCSCGASVPCFYSSKTNIEQAALRACKTCIHVADCTGCLLMCTEFEECKLKGVYDTLL